MQTYVMKKPILLIMSAILTGCVANAPVEEVSDLTVQVAEYKLMQAQQTGGSWINTNNLLEQARAALAAGDHNSALNLARQARFQGETALQQNQQQLDATPWQFQ